MVILCKHHLDPSTALIRRHLLAECTRLDVSVVLLDQITEECGGLRGAASKHDIVGNGSSALGTSDCWLRGTWISAGCMISVAG